ncbi:MAG: polysaccharide biosynthesis/export family protein [Blastocatellia bacterium]|nr:polysaccharide biosynthesis/export family protein [Blastocatellia bacterium]
MKRDVYPSVNLFSALSFLAVLLLAVTVAWPQTPEKSEKDKSEKPDLPSAQDRIPGADNSADNANDGSYRIGPGDVLEVRVFGRPELGREQRVGNKGTIRLPFLQELQVACKTEAELAQLIAEKYTKYLRDPQVDVFLKEYNSQPVAVIGSVTKPGRFQLQRRVRLLELLTFSGGPLLNAGGVVHIIRGTSPDYCEAGNIESTGAENKAAALAPIASPAGLKKIPDKTSSADQEQASSGTPPLPNQASPADQASLETAIDQSQAFLLTYKLQDVLKGRPDSNPYVMSGDIVSIPETDQVFVVGQVVKPGPLPVRSKITLLQAIGMAGGFTTDASKGKVKVVRTEPGTNVRTEFVYDINEIQKKKGEDIALMPNDVVDVPTSMKSNLARRAMGVGFGLATTLPIYIIP